MSPTRTHVFIADPDIPADLAGRRWGACCPLPDDNQVHAPPGRPPDDRSDHITGDHHND